MVSPEPIAQLVRQPSDSAGPYSISNTGSLLPVPSALFFERGVEIQSANRPFDGVMAIAIDGRLQPNVE